MNGRYVIFYALILAAMAGILIVGLFDRRFLDCDGPIQATMPNRGASPPPPATNSRDANYRRRIGSSDAHDTQQVTKTNLQEKFYSEEPTNRASATDCASDRLHPGEGVKKL